MGWLETDNRAISVQLNLTGTATGTELGKKTFIFNPLPSLFFLKISTRKKKKLYDTKKEGLRADLLSSNADSSSTIAILVEKVAGHPCSLYLGQLHLASTPWPDVILNNRIIGYIVNDIVRQL